MQRTAWAGNQGLGQSPPHQGLWTLANHSMSLSPKWFHTYRKQRLGSDLRISKASSISLKVLTTHLPGHLYPLLILTKVLFPSSSSWLASRTQPGAEAGAGVGGRHLPSPPRHPSAPGKGACPPAAQACVLSDSFFRSLVMSSFLGLSSALAKYFS